MRYLIRTRQKTFCCREVSYLNLVDFLSFGNGNSFAAFEGATFKKPATSFGGATGAVAEGFYSATLGGLVGSFGHG